MRIAKHKQYFFFAEMKMKLNTEGGTEHILHPKIVSLFFTS